MEKRRVKRPYMQLSCFVLWACALLVSISSAAFGQSTFRCDFFDKRDLFLGSARVDPSGTLQGSFISPKNSNSSRLKFKGRYSPAGLQLLKGRPRGIPKYFQFTGRESGCLNRSVECYATRTKPKGSKNDPSCSCTKIESLARFTANDLYTLCRDPASVATPIPAVTTPTATATALLDILVVGAHVTVDAASSTRVRPGSQASLSLRVDDGYRLLDLVGGTCPKGTWLSPTTYQTGSITTKCSVIFATAVRTFQVTVQTDAHVDATPKSLSVPANGSASVKFTAKQGFTLSREVRGSCPAGTWTGVGQYQTGPVKSDCTLIAISTPQTFKVTAASDAHTVVEPKSFQSVEYTGSVTFSVKATAPYTVLNSVTGTCPKGSWPTPGTYKTGAIVGDCSIGFASASPPPGAVLKAASATVLADGRIVEIGFTSPIPSKYSAPDWLPGALKGISLKTNSGLVLEHLGTYVTRAKLQRIAPKPPLNYPVEWQPDTNLKWTSTFLITDSSKVIPWDAKGLTVSADAGLLEDSEGNSTGAFTNLALENRSLVDPTGFTTKSFSRGTGGVTLYVSSSRGDDSNTLQAAQNPATPLKTPWKAMQLLYQYSGGGKNQQGQWIAPVANGSAVRLLRGDTFDNGATIMTFGQDRMHPFVLEDYWYDYTGKSTDPGTRPILKLNWENADRTLGAICYTGTCNHLVVRNLHLINNSFQFSLEGRDPSTTASDFTLDNVVIQDARRPSSKDGADADGLNVNLVSNFTLMRSIVVDAPAQGMHGDWMLEHFLVSQNVFDNNNKILPGCSNCSITAKGDILTHNLYLHDPAIPVIMWGNEISNASSHGVQARAGGVLAYNHFLSNAIAAFLAESGGAIYKNVVYGARDTSPTLPRGFGFSMSGDSSTSQAIEGNIVVNTVGRSPYALATATDGGSVKNGLLRHNTLYNSGSLILYATPFTAQIKSQHNLFAPLSGWDHYYAQSGLSKWYSADNNVLQISNMVTASNSVKSLAEWRTLHHVDDHSIDTTATMINAKASPGSYAEKLNLVGRLPTSGILSPPASQSTADLLTAGYISYLRNRPLSGAEASWSPAYDMIELYRYYASQYRPINLPALGTGRFDYYGASDYR